MGTEPTDVVNEERDDESGRFSSKYADEDFIEAIRILGGSAGTADVADEVGCPHRTAYHRLNELHEEGRIAADRVGNARYWRLVDGDE